MCCLRPAGPGQNHLAGIIANEMGTNMKVTSGPAIEKPGEMAAILNNLQEGDVLFVDEIHRLNRQVEEVLYPAMEDFAIDIMLGKDSTARSIRLDLPHFHLVGPPPGPDFSPAPFKGPVWCDPAAGILYAGGTENHYPPLQPGSWALKLTKQGSHGAGQTFQGTPGWPTVC